MRLLLDECVPRRLKRELSAHEVFTVDEAGFKGLKNGKLIAAAVGNEFNALITVDRNIQHQQNKEKLPIAVLILSAYSNRYESLSPLIPEALRVLEIIKTGEIIILE